MKKEEALKCYGGAAVSAALVNATLSFLKMLYVCGQNFGSSIKRTITKTSC